MIVICKNEHGAPVRVDMENFNPVVHQLMFLKPMVLKVTSAIEDGYMRHFIVGEDGATVYPDAFPTRDDAVHIMGEIQNGWMFKPTPVAEPVDITGWSLGRSGKKFILVSGENSEPVTLPEGRENSFDSEAAVFEYLGSLQPKS